MKTTARTLVIVLAMTHGARPIAQRAADDAQIISAALTQTVRREVDKLLARPDGWRGSPLVILLEQSIAMCPDKTGPWENCIEASTLQFAAKHSGWSGALAAEFVKRNERSAPVPRLDLPNTLMIPFDAASGRRPPDRYPKAAGWVAVSTPACIDSRTALVYVDFACGALCCHEWFILLERAASGWRVKQEHRVAIC